MPESNSRGTVRGSLRFIQGFWIRIPNAPPPAVLGGVDSNGSAWRFHALPEIQVTKEANYSDIQILGRSSPIKTYTGSGYRRLAVTFHLWSTNAPMKDYHIAFVRALDSLLFPQYGGTYIPPPVAQLKHGTLIGNQALAGAFEGTGDSSNDLGSFVNVICMSTSYTLDPNIVHLGDSTMMPQYLAIQANFDVVYPFAELPGSSDVLRGNY